MLKTAIKLNLILYICRALALSERGYMALGGEFLVIPLLFLIRYLYKEAKELWTSRNY